MKNTKQIVIGLFIVILGFFGFQTAFGAMNQLDGSILSAERNVSGGNYTLEQKFNFPEGFIQEGEDLTITIRVNNPDDWESTPQYNYLCLGSTNSCTSLSGTQTSPGSGGYVNIYIPYPTSTIFNAGGDVYLWWVFQHDGDKAYGTNQNLWQEGDVFWNSNFGNFTAYDPNIKAPYIQFNRTGGNKYLRWTLNDWGKYNYIASAPFHNSITTSTPSSIFDVDCSASGTSGSASSTIGEWTDMISCYVIKKPLWAFAKALIVPPKEASDYFSDGLRALQTQFPFSIFFTLEKNLETAIKNASSTTTLSFDIPNIGTLTALTSSTLQQVVGTSTKNAIFEVIENIIWLATGITILVIFI